MQFTRTTTKRMAMTNWRKTGFELMVSSGWVGNTIDQFVSIGQSLINQMMEIRGHAAHIALLLTTADNRLSIVRWPIMWVKYSNFQFLVFMPIEWVYSAFCQIFYQRHIRNAAQIHVNTVSPFLCEKKTTHKQNGELESFAFRVLLNFPSGSWTFPPRGRNSPNS